MSVVSRSIDRLSGAAPSAVIVGIAIIIAGATRP
jgi:hypothetical protein